jgi:hypothetical protein
VTHHSITLANPQHGHQTIERLWAWMKPRLLQGRRVTLSVAEEKRSLPQNDKLQALVRDIGRAAEYPDHDRLRLLLCEQWRHETRRPAQYAPSLDGLRMVDVSNRTSKKDRADISEFIDWLEAWKAANESK